MLSRSEFLEFINYNEHTGILTWIKSPHHRCKIGQECGSLHKHKRGAAYRQVRLKDKYYQAHRLIWFLYYGVWPDNIDHINGNPLDNRIINLRNVGHTENQKNKGISKANKTGIVGVYFDNKSNVWSSQITTNNKSIRLYRGKDLFLACCARKSAEIRYGFHENHGRRMATGKRILAVSANA